MIGYAAFFLTLTLGAAFLVAGALAAGVFAAGFAVLSVLAPFSWLTTAASALSVSQPYDLPFFSTPALRSATRAVAGATPSLSAR